MKDNVKLGTLGDIFIGLTYRPEDVANEGTIVLRSSNIQNGRLDFDDIVRVKCKVRENLIVKPNDILMCSRNGSAKLVGKCTLLPEMDEEMSFGAFMTIIRTQHNPYLLHFFNSNAFRCQLGSASTTTINQITRKMLDDISVPLYPKEQEDYIVSVFNQIDELIWTETKKLTLLDKLVKSRFVELFDDCNKQTSIKESGLTISDGNYSSKYPRSEEFVESGIPFIRANNLKNGTVVDEDMYFITPEKHAILLKGHLKPNDVLITTRGNIGQVAIVPDEHNDSNINAQIVLLRDKNGRFVPQYLLWALQAEETKAQYIELQTGTALKQLPVGRLEQVVIKEPPIDLQQQFAAFVEQVDKSKLAVQNSIAELEELKKSLMQRYFG